MPDIGIDCVQYRNWFVLLQEWLIGTIATLGSNLGISTWLEILQSCKLDHKVALFSTWLPPTTHQPTHQPLGQKTCLKESNIFGMSIRLLGNVWNVSGWCLEGILKKFWNSKKCELPDRGRGGVLVHSVQLGNFSLAWNLAHLQVGPQRGYKMYVGPPSHPPTASIISHASMKDRKLKFTGCLVGV